MLLSLTMAIKQLDHDVAVEALGVLSAALSFSIVLHCTSLLVCFYLLPHTICRAKTGFKREFSSLLA